MDFEIIFILGASALGGFIRGFAGFGAALVIVPLATIVIAPPLAIIMMCLIEGPTAIWLLRKSWSQVRLREILIISGGALIGSPIGVQILILLDQITLRWIICVLILIAIACLASGWRYQRKVSPFVSAAVGFTSGVTGSVAAVGLPPVVLFWLSGRTEPASITRANILAFSVFLIAVVLFMLALRGLYTTDIVLTAAIVFPVFIVAAWLGERAFAATSNERYKLVALAICAIAAVVGLPFWSGH